MIYLKLTLTAVFWGGTFVAGRFIAPDIGPFSGAFLRFLFASMALTAFMYLREGSLPRLNPRQAVLAVILGLTGVFAYNVLFLAGLKSVTAGRASIIIANNPVFLALFSSMIFKEHLGAKKITGILLSLGGALIAITRGDLSMITRGAFGIGELMLFGCVASWVAYSMFGKKLMSGLSPMAAVTYSSLFGAGFLFVPAYVEGISRSFIHYGLMTWMGVLYLALFGTVIGFTWFYEGVNTIGPTRSGVFINFVPISAIILAFILLGEDLDKSLVIGISLVTTGVFLTNRPEKPIGAETGTPGDIP